MNFLIIDWLIAERRIFGMSLKTLENDVDVEIFPDTTTIVLTIQGTSAASIPTATIQNDLVSPVSI